MSIERDLPVTPGEHTPPFLEPPADSVEHAVEPQHDFVVFYDLAAVTLIQAPTAQEAQDSTVSALTDVLGKLRAGELKPDDVATLRLVDAEIRIEDVWSAPASALAKLPEPPSPEPASDTGDPVEVVNFSREDLEKLGFDSRQISDANMERLASHMSKLYWPLLKIVGEGLRLPQHQNVIFRASRTNG